MASVRIEEGFEVFTSDGTKAIGAVRQVIGGKEPSLVIYIENAGDFEVPAEVIQDVHSQKVILNFGRLEERLRQAIRRAHDAEDPTI